jgi:hypothetical protein
MGIWETHWRLPLHGRCTGRVRCVCWPVRIGRRSVTGKYRQNTFGLGIASVSLRILARNCPQNRIKHPIFTRSAWRVPDHNFIVALDSVRRAGFEGSPKRNRNILNQVTDRHDRCRSRPQFRLCASRQKVPSAS